MKCRSCGSEASEPFLDLGTAPPSNAYLAQEDLAKPEAWFPLQLFTCPGCLLVQVDEVQPHEQLFSSDYAYHSSYSRSWLDHAKRFVADAVRDLGLDGQSRVVEVASNDGYLLQYVAELGIPCLGVEPTESTANVAIARGIPTIVRFFGRELAKDILAANGPSDLVIGNNVLAHVPDLHDFASGMAEILAAEGTISLEFPHLLRLVRERQFDTVYHEHFSYFSLHSVQTVLAAHGLRVWRVDELGTHGGSLRVWACHFGSVRSNSDSVETVLAAERSEGMLEMDWYRGFQSVAESTKDEFLAFLLRQKQAGKLVAAYGAAAKGNTLLNFAGIRRDLINFVVDASPYKQNRFLPGSRIPVVPEAWLQEKKPDFVVVLPWNLLDEIRMQLHYVRQWGGKLVRAVPTLTVD